MGIEDALTAQGVDSATGLSSDEVASRTKQYGPNSFTAAKKESRFQVFLRQFKDPMQIVLLVAGVITIVALQQWGTGIVLLGLTLFNAMMGLRQEGKAEASVAALQKMLIVKTRVRRDGQVVQLAAEELVPGDIVLVEAGDRVPADGRLLRTATLEIDESALTGESVPVPKQTESVAGADTPLGDRVDMAYMNTNVTRGTAEILVTATGMSTEVGHISGMLQATELEKTPLTSPAGCADQADHHHRHGRPGRVDRHWYRARTDPRRVVSDRRRVCHRRDSDRATGGGHLPARDRHDDARRGACHCQAAALGGDARRDVGDQLRQDGHAHAESDDGCRDGDDRPASDGHGRGLFHGRSDHAGRGPAGGGPRAVPDADGAGLGRGGARRRPGRRPDGGRVGRAGRQGRHRRGGNTQRIPPRRRSAIRRRLQADGDVSQDDGRATVAKSSAALSKARRINCWRARPTR